MTQSSLSAVIVQDRLNTYGGGERVVKHLTEAIPGDVEVITGEYVPSQTYDFSAHPVTELSANAFSAFVGARVSVDWTDYDIAFLSGNRPQFLQWRQLPIPTVRYCHSPTRTFWAMRDRAFRQAWPFAKMARLILSPIYRAVDAQLNQMHEQILTNSQNTRSQVHRFYGLSATVVSPPVNVEAFECAPHEDYWLSVNRLVPKKRVELQVDSFSEVDETLVVVGAVDSEFAEFGHQLTRRIENHDNIRLETSVSEARLRELYSRAKGVVYTPVFEDFGIVPVEAMASGKPVVAVAEGGPIETVQDGRTGWLIEPTVSDIRKVTTSDFEPEQFREACLRRSQRYSTERFATEIRQLVTELT